jgi:UDP-perosamine 4-acetyltransferase
MKDSVVILGAGGHAKVVIELFRAVDNLEIVGCTTGSGFGRTVCGVPVIGPDAVLPGLRAGGVRYAFVATGDNALRERLGAAVLAMGFELPNAISPSAVISPSVVLGKGIAIMGGVVINAESRVGDLTIANTNSSIDHDCRIGRAVHIAPGCALAGNVTVGDRSFLGVGVCVIPDVTIGADVILGSGSVVVRDLPNGARAIGVPARVR